jgi:hypothetical protein
MALIWVMDGSVPTSPHRERLMEFHGLRFMINLVTGIPSRISSLATEKRPLSKGEPLIE